MRYDGLPKMLLALGILALTILASNMQVTRVTQDAHVYRIQLLGHIMMVCPETFYRTSDKVDCERWLRRTRGGGTVFVQHHGLPDNEGPAVETAGLEITLPRITTADDVSEPHTVKYSIRPRPRPTN